MRTLKGKYEANVLFSEQMNSLMKILFKFLPDIFPGFEQYKESSKMPCSLKYRQHSEEGTMLMWTAGNSESDNSLLTYLYSQTNIFIATKLNIL